MTPTLKSLPPTMVVSLTLSLLILSPSLHAGNVYKCTQSDGSVTYSNSACAPGATSNAIVQPERRSTPDAGSTYDRYSVIEQARRIEERKQMEQAQRAARQGNGAERQDQTGPGASTPALSYESALQQATEDAGYRRYSQLTALQKERVHAELGKYGYLPRTQRQEITTPLYSDDSQSTYQGSNQVELRPRDDSDPMARYRGQVQPDGYTTVRNPETGERLKGYIGDDGFGRLRDSDGNVVRVRPR